MSRTEDQRPPGRITSISVVAPLRIDIPMKMRRHNGRREVIVPEHAGAGRDALRLDPQQALVIALARAHVWQRALETGRFRNIEHIAGELELDSSYVGRILRLALLPPGVQEAILKGEEQRSLAEVLGGGVASAVFSGSAEPVSDELQPLGDE